MQNPRRTDITLFQRHELPGVLGALRRVALANGQFTEAEAAKRAVPEPMYFDVPKVLRALARGAACTVDFSDHFDFFSHANEPVAALRERWRVPPLVARGQ